MSAQGHNTSTLDAQAFPHLIDCVIDNLCTDSPETAIRLCIVCKDWQHRIGAKLASRLRIDFAPETSAFSATASTGVAIVRQLKTVLDWREDTCDVTTYQGECWTVPHRYPPLPRMHPLLCPNILKDTRTLDLQWDTMHWMGVLLVEGLPNLSTIRISGGLSPDNLVVQSLAAAAPHNLQVVLFIDIDRDDPLPYQLFMITDSAKRLRNLIVHCSASGLREAIWEISCWYTEELPMCITVFFRHCDGLGDQAIPNVADVLVKELQGKIDLIPSTFDGDRNEDEKALEMLMTAVRDRECDTTRITFMSDEEYQQRVGKEEYRLHTFQ